MSERSAEYLRKGDGLVGLNFTHVNFPVHAQDEASTEEVATTEPNMTVHPDKTPVEDHNLVTARAQMIVGIDRRYHGRYEVAGSNTTTTPGDNTFSRYRQRSNDSAICAVRSRSCPA